jgi:malate synthase
MMTENKLNDPIKSYLRLIPPALIDQLWRVGESVEGLEDLRVAPGLLGEFGHLETPEALGMMCALYEEIKPALARLLEQREIDRAFIDERTAQYAKENQGIPYLSPLYKTVIGDRDDRGRLVVGAHKLSESQEGRAGGPEADSLTSPPAPLKRVSIPDWLKGDQVTLFGPPDTLKMSINAMNALHHRLPDEPPIVGELVTSSGNVPRWGADNEDSKTPIMRRFLSACDHLIGCFEGTLSFDDPKRGKQYRLKERDLSRPIKRIPGLALPDGSHLWRGEPIPFHLYDFFMHLYHNWRRPEALAFYIPKLENEEEAAYLRALIERAEHAIKALHPTYEIGTVALFIVFENPRAIFRIREIADTLHPYFIGGSLGWHDFLASTARLFKHDSNYQIPVKADPNIVINHIKESHLILRSALEPIGGIAIGGMYGTLYEEGNPKSFEVSMVGYIKDVITQMKRGLDGFWVAHPNFVRIGIALVEAWRRYERDPTDSALTGLISALVPNMTERAPLLDFVYGDDVEGLAEDHPLYQRGVLAADIETSDVIANSDEAEVRYNIFQALQYLTDWLCGNGCVALPAQLTNASGEEVFVRVMDDLATTERSRWELWAEVAHGRVSRADFERMLSEEADFIRLGLTEESKRVQVRWEGEAARWYPIAIEVLHQLVTDPSPVEFVPELILPYTFDLIRTHPTPLEAVNQLKNAQP